MDGTALPQANVVPQHQSRRRFLRIAAQILGLGSLGMVTACQSPPETIVVTPPPANGSGTQSAPPTATAAATPSPTPMTIPAAASTPPASTSLAAATPATTVSVPLATAAPMAPVAQERRVSGRPMYQMNAQHTGRSPHIGPEQPALRRSFDTAQPGLRLEDPGDPRPEIQSSAAIAPDGTIYIGNFPGALYAFRDPNVGETLEVVWRFHPPGASSFHTTPALGPDGTVYVGFSTGGTSPEARGTFYAIRAASAGQAQAVWSVDLGPGRQTASPTIGDDQTIYVVSGAGQLFAIALTGMVRWTAKVGPTIKTSPALASDGTVYVPSMDGRLYAVSPPTSGDQREGAIRWTFDFGQYPGSTPLVRAPAPPPGADAIGSGASATIAPDGMIYIGANNSNMYAITPDGSLKWLFEAEREVAGIWSAAALGLDNHSLYFGANRGGLYALDRDTGSLRWQFNVHGSVYSSPTLDSQGTLYAGSTVGHVFALQSETGRMIWDFDARAPVWTAPALRPDGTLVVGDTSGRVMLIGNR
jgi:outer membrane protein assembly factor BamB